MAETTKTAQKPAPAPAPVEAPPPAPVLPPPPPSKAELAWRKFSKAAASLMTMTFWLVLGAGLVLLGFLEHFSRLTHHLPKGLEPILHLVRFPYLFVGLGLFCLGTARSYSFREYSAEVKKNKKSPHRWKIPLIGTQVFLLNVGGIYALLVAIQKVQPVQNMVALTFALFLAMGYGVWYLIGWLKNHFETLASARIAMAALVLGALSYGFWAISQEIVMSLMTAFYALVTALASVSAAYAKGPEQKLAWSRTLCLFLTMIFVGVVAWNSLNVWPHHQPTTDLKGMTLVVGDPGGEVGTLAYGPRVYERKADDRLTQKIAFGLKAKDGWYLEIADAEDLETPTIKVRSGEGAFKPMFIEDGKTILLDPVQGGNRSLWRVDAKTGKTIDLGLSGVLPFGNGVPWHQDTRQLIFVTQGESGYRLNLWSASTGTVRTVFRSENPILTPSFTHDGKSVVYADGIAGYFRIRDLRTGETDFLQSQVERSERRMEGLPPVSEVIPAPDGFRYLYLTLTDGKTSFWEVLADGTKRERIHEPKGSVRNISWTPDGQKVIYEEKRRQLGYLLPIENIRVLDANLESLETLISPQLSHRSPAASPDGAKIAFVASQGLWYPISGTGVWVAMVR